MATYELTCQTNRSCLIGSSCLPNIDSKNLRVCFTQLKLEFSNLPKVKQYIKCFRFIKQIMSSPPTQFLHIIIKRVNVKCSSPPIFLSIVFLFTVLFHYKIVSLLKIIIKKRQTCGSHGNDIAIPNTQYF